MATWTPKQPVVFERVKQALAWIEPPAYDIWAGSPMTRRKGAKGLRSQNDTINSIPEAEREVVRVIRVPHDGSGSFRYRLMDGRSVAALDAITNRLQELCSLAREGRATDYQLSLALFIDKSLRVFLYSVAESNYSAKSDCDNPTDWSYTDMEITFLDLQAHLIDVHPEYWAICSGLPMPRQETPGANACLGDEWIAFETAVNRVDAFRHAVQRDIGQSSDHLSTLRSLIEGMAMHEPEYTRIMMHTSVETGQRRSASPADEMDNAATPPPRMETRNKRAATEALDGAPVKKIRSEFVKNPAFKSTSDGGWGPSNPIIPWMSLEASSRTKWQAKSCPEILLEGVVEPSELAGRNVIVGDRPGDENEKTYRRLDAEAESIVRWARDAVALHIFKYRSMTSTYRVEVLKIKHTRWDMEWTLYAEKVLRRQQYLMWEDGGSIKDAQDLHPIKAVFLLRELRDLRRVYNTRLLADDQEASIAAARMEARAATTELQTAKEVLSTALTVSAVGPSEQGAVGQKSLEASIKQAVEALGRGTDVVVAAAKKHGFSVAPQSQHVGDLYNWKDERQEEMMTTYQHYNWQNGSPATGRSMSGSWSNDINGKRLGLSVGLGGSPMSRSNRTNYDGITPPIGSASLTPNPTAGPWNPPDPRHQSTLTPAAEDFGQTIDHDMLNMGDLHGGDESMGMPDDPMFDPQTAIDSEAKVVDTQWEEFILSAGSIGLGGPLPDWQSIVVKEGAEWILLLSAAQSFWNGGYSWRAPEMHILETLMAQIEAARSAGGLTEVQAHTLNEAYSWSKRVIAQNRKKCRVDEASKVYGGA